MPDSNRTPTAQLRADGSLRHLLTLEGLPSQVVRHLLERSEHYARPLSKPAARNDSLAGRTVAVMFAEQKSPVHLTAPAAVAESLRNVRIHHVANQQAIGAALDSILQAFSPEALLGRFEHYRRTGTPGVADEGWAWNMYQHYYRELTSARQQGFDKLFHQVYAQAYDQAVRQQQGLI